MAGSIWGRIFQISTWGESHGAGLGVVIDGCPAGLSLTEEDIQIYLDRRKPGQNTFTTKRQESDKAEILSGIFEGKTTGSPISILIRNKDQRTQDYHDIMDKYRPGHADYSFDQKYGFRDYRGGGRSSGRETIGRVAAGAVAAKILKTLGIEIKAYTKSIGPISIPESEYDFHHISLNPLNMPNNAYAALAAEYLTSCKSQEDSCGSTIECVVTGLPAGIGDPVFDKLDALLAQAMLSIGSVKGFEMGDGFQSATKKGSETNDPFVCNHETVCKTSNHSGGTLGGISDGSPLVFRLALKPTPSISQPQHSVNQNGEAVVLTINGRHDPVIAPRAVVVVEAMAALTIVDLLFTNMSAKMDTLKSVYSRLE